VKTFKQVRIRQKRRAEGNRVGLSCRQHRAGGCLGKVFIGNVTPAKSRFQLRPDALFTKRFTGADECNAGVTPP